MIHRVHKISKEYFGADSQMGIEEHEHVHV